MSPVTILFVGALAMSPVALVGCNAAAPEKVCAHVREVGATANDCVATLARRQREDPAGYAKLAGCVMSARTKSSVASCDPLSHSGDFFAEKPCTCTAGDPLCSCQ